jgi:hypothetical protein
VRDLHNTWAQGSSFVNILASPRSFNVVALAGLAVTLAPMNGPLLQRSSFVTQRTREQVKNLTIPIALEFPRGYTGDIAGLMGSYEPTAITRPFSNVLKQYNKRQSINITGVGCEGVCTGTLLGAGYDIECWNQSIPDPNLQNRTREDSNYGYSITPFNSSFAYIAVGDAVINFTVTLKTDPRLEANWTLSQCLLRPATIEYPVIFTNETTALDPSRSWRTDRTNKLRSTIYIGHAQGPTTHGGVWLYLQALYKPSMGATYESVRGWRGWYDGAAAYRYVNNVGWMGYQASFDQGAEVSFFDPTSDAMNTVREIAWRVALYIPPRNLGVQDARSRLLNMTSAEWADAYLQHVEVQQTTTQFVYQSQYVYLSIAVTITLCATFCVLALSGWWNLGREVSLSPIEIAKAFAAPSLQSTNSNCDMKSILKDIGEEKLRYGAAWDDQVTKEASVATLRFDRAARCDRPRNAQVVG